MHRRGNLIIALCFLILSVPTAQAEEASDVSKRPKIGLVLSGGGARGGAHAGVLKALEELDVQIDYIAGTSMGAIVGGLYAAGYRAADIDRLMIEMDWDAAFKDRPDRRDETMRKKELDAEFLIPFRLGFNGGSIQLPLGVVEGQHLDQILQRILFSVQAIENFDQLPIPFRAVAADLVTGKEVVLSGGSLADALRASMSVPGVFAPVRLDGLLLVDGGVANNLPVNVVREMGADIVIAVDISSPLLKEEELKSVLSVTAQLTNFLTRNNTERQIESLRSKDILIVPNLEGVSSADFEAAAEVAEIGYQAVMDQPEQFAGFPVAIPNLIPTLDQGGTPDEYIVHFVEIDNQSVLNDELIRSRIKVPIGEPLDIDALNRMVDDVYGLDVFQSVTYSLGRNEQGETGIVIDASPRSWGPNYLQFGLEFSDDFSGSSEFKLGAAYTRKAMNSYGGELRVIVAIGREDELSLDFYQPIDKEARWFVESEVFAGRQQFNVWEGDTRLAILDIVGEGARVSFGRNINSTNLVRLGYEFQNGRADYIAGVLPGPLDDNVDIGELQLEYRHDSLDSLYFPTEGTFHRLGYLYASEELGAGSDYQQATAAGSFVITGGKNTVLLNYAMGYSFSDKAPIERWFELGGFGRLSGLVPDQLSGRQMGLFSLAYYRRLNDIDFIPAYAGVSLEAGNVWNYSDDISFGDLRTSGSLFIGADTPLGPVYLAWGYSDGGDSTFYFYLGNPFRRFRF